MLNSLYSMEKIAISQSDLNRMLDDHEAFIARQGGVRAILRNAKLDGLSLANRNLFDVDMTGASLVGADLHGANLTHVKLSGADLRDCNLRNARLERADLRGASFKGANLAYATLDNADLGSATMVAEGKAAHPGAAGDGVDFSNCSLRNASFGNAKLDKANFSDALLQGAVFRGAALANAEFRGAVLLGVNLKELQVPPEALKDCITSPSQDAEARAEAVAEAILGHHAWVTSNGLSGRPAQIDGEDLRPLGDRLRGLHLAGISARGVIALGVDFTSCQLQAAKFEGADLRGALFINADLSGTNLDQAKLAHANFTNAVIQDLVLRDGRTVKAQAQSAQAAPEQFHAAKMTSKTFAARLSPPKPAFGRAKRP